MTTVKQAAEQALYTGKLTLIEQIERTIRAYDAVPTEDATAEGREKFVNALAEAIFVSVDRYRQFEQEVQAIVVSNQLYNGRKAFEQAFNISE